LLLLSIIFINATKAVKVKCFTVDRLKIDNQQHNKKIKNHYSFTRTYNAQLSLVLNEYSFLDVDKSKHTNRELTMGLLSILKKVSESAEAQ